MTDFLRSIRIAIRSVKIGVLNLFFYFNVIWNDRDWDGVYFYYIMMAKLKKIEKRYANPDNYYIQDEEANRILKHVRLAIKLLDLMIEDDYMPKEYWDNVKIQFEDDPNNSEYVTINTVSNYSDEERRQIHADCDRKRRKTKQLFFSILNKRIDRWWD